LIFQPGPLPQQLTVDEWQKVAQLFHMAAIRLKLSVELGIVPFWWDRFGAQSRADSQQF